MPAIERAIFSCHDKQGILELARVLGEFKAEIISTEGTHRVLAEAGVATREMAEFTGVRELMGGRVKSLHPKIHAGLLGVRDNKLHAEEIQTYGYQWIDMLVVNIRPLDELLDSAAVSPEEVIAGVDIGGISMIRSAAKNYRYVTVVTNPDRYTTIIHELRAHDGAVSYPTRFRLAQEAFELIAKYDALVADYMRRCEPPEE